MSALNQYALIHLCETENGSFISNYISNFMGKTEYAIIKVTSSYELLSRIDEFSGAIIFFEITNKPQLMDLVQFLKTNKKRLRENEIKVSGINHTKNPEVDKVLRKLLVSEIFDQEINNKSLQFKINLLFKTIKPKKKTYSEDEAQTTIAETKKNNYETKLKSSTKLKNPIKYEAPLKIQSDCFYFPDNKPAKNVMNNWVIEMIGPGPIAGHWHDITKQSNSVTPVWKWGPSNESLFQFVLEDGHWIFKGSEPLFNWETNKWKFAGKAPELIFFHNKPIASKFFVENNILHITENSNTATSMLPKLQESFDPKYQFSKESHNLLEGENQSEGNTSTYYSSKAGLSNIEDQDGIDQLGTQKKPDQLDNKYRGKISNSESVENIIDDIEDDIQKELNHTKSSFQNKSKSSSIEETDNPSDQDLNDHITKKHDGKQKERKKSSLPLEHQDPNLTGQSEINKQDDLLKGQVSNHDLDFDHHPQYDSKNEKRHDPKVPHRKDRPNLDQHQPLIDEFDLDEKLKNQELRGDEGHKLQQKIKEKEKLKLEKKELQKKEAKERLKKIREGSSNKGDKKKHDNILEEMAAMTNLLDDSHEIADDSIDMDKLTELEELASKQSSTHNLVEMAKEREIRKKKLQEEKEKQRSSLYQDQENSNMSSSSQMGTEHLKDGANPEIHDSDKDYDKFLRGGSAKKEGKEKKDHQWAGPMGSNKDLDLGNSSKSHDDQDNLQSLDHKSQQQKIGKKIDTPEAEKRSGPVGSIRSLENKEIPTRPEIEKVGSKLINFNDITLQLTLLKRDINTHLFDIKNTVKLIDSDQDILVLESNGSISYEPNEPLVLHLYCKYGTKIHDFSFSGRLISIDLGEAELLNIALTKYRQKDLETLIELFAERQNNINNFLNAATGRDAS